MIFVLRRAAAISPRSSARTAPARPPSSTASPASTSRPRDGSRCATATHVWSELDALTEGLGQRTRRRHALPSRAHADYCPQKARVARTFQNIRLFAGMTVLENFLVAQHNPLMRASGFTLLGILGLPIYVRAEKRRHRPGATYWLDQIAPDSRAPTIPPAICPMAPSGASKSRAPCAPTRYCSASTSRQPVSTRARAESSTSFLRADPRRARACRSCLSSTTCQSSWKFPTTSSCSTTA